MVFRAIEPGFGDRDRTVVRFPERPRDVADTERDRAGDRTDFASGSYLARPLVGGTVDRPLGHRGAEQMLTPALRIEDGGSA
jgi:hypothetical protein